MIRMLLSAALVAAAAAPAADKPEKPDYVPEDHKLVYHQQFDDANALKDFEFTNPAKWKWSKVKQADGKTGGAMESLGGKGYKTKVRSPYVIGLLSGKVVGDFVLEADLLQTGRDYGHRDMCLFFGFTDPSKYYYVHMATKADPHAHNVFIVNDKPRTAIADKTTKGIDWGREKWHHVRLVRDVGEGTIEVYYDDMSKPIMVASDKTFASGRIGFGSFDDVGMVDNVRLWAPLVKTTDKKTFWKPGETPDWAKKK